MPLTRLCMFVSTPIYDTLVKLDMGAKKPLEGGEV